MFEVTIDSLLQIFQNQMNSVWNKSEIARLSWKR